MLLLSGFNLATATFSNLLSIAFCLFSFSYFTGGDLHLLWINKEEFKFLLDVECVVHRKPCAVFLAVIANKAGKRNQSFCSAPVKRSFFFAFSVITVAAKCKWPLKLVKKKRVA